jgi:hypothetical protein
MLVGKLERIKEKQSKKKDLKYKLKQQLREASSGKKENISSEIPSSVDVGHKSQEPLIIRDVLIRLKPLTDAAKEIIAKEKKQIPNMQFRLKVVVSGVAPLDQNDSGERTVRDIIKAVSKKWSLR